MIKKRSNFGKNRVVTKGLLAMMVVSLGIASLGLTGCANDFAEASSKQPEAVESDDIDQTNRLTEKQMNQMRKEEKKQRDELLKDLDQQLDRLEKISLIIEKKQNLEKIKKNDPNGRMNGADRLMKLARKPSDDKSYPSMADELKEERAEPSVTAVPQEVDGSYFADALFIGDSRMQGFMLYSGVEATGYTESGLGVATVMTKPFVKYGGSRLTVPQALAISQYSKIYICLGMNELGWINTDKFVQQYGAVIDQIKTLQPNAKIVMEALLPVTEAKDNQGTNVNNDRIALYNQLIKKLAADKGVRFIDPSPAVSDEKGFLKAEATTDGVHLNKQYCELWYQYMLKNY